MTIYKFQQVGKKSKEDEQPETVKEPLVSINNKKSFKLSLSQGELNIFHHFLVNHFIFCISYLFIFGLLH